jgi:hypothetical protein
MDVLFPHYQVGGVLTENCLPTWEYQVLGEEVVDGYSLERALEEVDGCETMPPDLKKFFNRGGKVRQLFQDYGKLLSKEIVKIPDAPDEPLERGTVCVMPGGVTHAGPPCPTEKIRIAFFRCMTLGGTKAEGKLGARGPNKKIYHR